MSTLIQEVENIVLHLVFVRRGMEIDQGSMWVRHKLERSWNKLSPSVQEMMLHKYEAASRTLTVLDPVVNARPEVSQTEADQL